MKNLIKNDIFMARRFNNTMRYIDDFLILNNIQFNDAIQDIYPSELQLKKTTEQGFRYAELCKAFRRFAKSHLHCKNYRSVRRHIEDGVCFPASDGFLGRHVSTRRRSCGIGG